MKIRMCLYISTQACRKKGKKTRQVVNTDWWGAKGEGQRREKKRKPKRKRENDKKKLYYL